MENNQHGNSSRELRIKLSLGSFNVELEGPSQDVISQFEEIKKNGLGQMMEQLIPFYSKEKVDTFVKKEDNATAFINSGNNYQNISLQDVVLKMLPTSEKEWILIYAIYIFQSGKETFTREDILMKYQETKRKTKQRIKNLSNSIQGAVQKGWISALNDQEYIIKQGGNDYAEEIISRTESSVKNSHKKASSERNK